MRSLKKKSSQDLSSPSSVANYSVTPQQQKATKDRNNDDRVVVVSPTTITTTATSNNANQQERQLEQQKQQQQQQPPSTTPIMSLVSSKDNITGSESATYDVKKILSKPFGREHILTTEQTVSFNQSK